ncbi:flavin prenyltransferase UbiX [Granulosicoccaceae sp. 1_MG-2023]|nr:flavin prenyltransferase UbiX [Granulosicoccaceae sp. 1_MG-2023]
MQYAKTFTLAMTGASGIQYGLRLMECLVRADCRVFLLMSKPAQICMGMDTDIPVPQKPADMQRQFSALYGAGEGQIVAFGSDQWTAPIASGSGVADAMVICPCTTGTLAAVAAGNCNSLLERAADVSLKEGRKLILMPREMPFSVIHLENMLRLARAGAVIMPPNPAFYQQPQSIDDLVDFVVARVLDQLGVEQDLMPRWGSER